MLETNTSNHNKAGRAHEGPSQFARQELGHVTLQGEGISQPEGDNMLHTASEELVSPERKNERAKQLLRQLEADSTHEIEIPSDIASEVAILAQKELNVLDEDGIVDHEYITLEAIRNRAAIAADELAFELVALSDAWSQHARLNAVHEKFKNVSVEELSKFLGDDNRYEYKAMYIRDILADHAPELLTHDLRVLVDPNQPLWRSSSTHASVLLRHRGRSNADSIQVNHIPTSLPTGDRVEYRAEDSDAMKPIVDMSDDELMLYVHPDAVDAVRQNGSARFDELTLAARETVLTRRLFETTAKSQDKSLKDQASERNKSFEHQPVFQEGDLVHATSSAEVLSSMLDHGLRCGEAVMGNDRTTIKYPLTISTLEVDESIARAGSITERLNLLNNDGYGAINIILHRDEFATPQTEGQAIGVRNQRQIFAGLPSIEMKGIVIRDSDNDEQMISEVIQAVVKNGMFIPIYKGSTGEPLLTSEQFNQLRES